MDDAISRILAGSPPACPDIPGFPTDDLSIARARADLLGSSRWGDGVDFCADDPDRFTDYLAYLHSLIEQGDNVALQIWVNIRAGVEGVYRPSTANLSTSGPCCRLCEWFSFGRGKRTSGPVTPEITADVRRTVTESLQSEAGLDAL